MEVEVVAEAAVAAEAAAEAEAAGGPPPVTFSDQPPMLPKSMPASSTMYSDHVPSAVPPSKVESAAFPLGVGAGAGNGSPGS